MSIDFFDWTWFGSESRTRYNIGIVTGKLSEITVVDIDSKVDFEWWSDNFPATPLAATTGGGGAHMYYRTNPAVQIRNRAGLFGRKIDIRGEGGYVVAPPSVHDETGKTYKWEPWRNYSLDQIPVFDPGCLELDVTRSVMGTGTNLAKSTKSRVHHGPAYISQIFAISGQGGHNATFRAACESS